MKIDKGKLEKFLKILNYSFLLMYELLDIYLK